MSEEALQQPVRKNARSAKNNRRGDGWQAEKSAMTRKAILDAAVSCFVDKGYARTTTALIAEYAGVSRGAMMHHFPSRIAVIHAVVNYLHEMRLREYETLMTGIDAPDGSMSRAAVRRSVEAAWEYSNMPSFVAYHELLAAARTDAELDAVISGVEKDFEKQFLAAAKNVFPHWKDTSVIDAAHDLVHFTMRGMALSHLITKKSQRAKRIIDILTDELVALYEHEAKLN